MHIEKYNKMESRAILQHDLRKNKTYSNENIDTEKKDKNVCFCARGYKYIDRYIDKHKVKIHGRNGKMKNEINYTASLILHYPENCRINENDFFKMAHIILSKKFGKDNIVCSIVHKDEIRPHLHFVFMPITKDKRGRKKLCCKEVVNREMLKTLHGDVEKAFKTEFDIDVKLQNEEKGQFKNITHIEDYKKVKDLEREYNEIKEDMKQLEIQKQDLEIDNYILGNQINNLKQKLEELEKKFSSTTSTSNTK